MFRLPPQISNPNPTPGNWMSGRSELMNWIRGVLRWAAMIALVGLVLLAILLVAGGPSLMPNLLQSIAQPFGGGQVIIQAHELPGGFYCLGDTLIWAPNGLLVYGTVPESLQPCRPSANPLAGSWKGKNYVIETQGGWIWNPRMGKTLEGQ